MVSDTMFLSVIIRALLLRSASMKRILSLLGLAFLCQPAMAGHQVDLGLNSDALRLVYTYAMSESPVLLDGGWMYHSDNGNVVHVGVNLSDVASSGSKELVGGLGARVAYQKGDLTGQDGLAVPIGGFLMYTPARFNRFTLGFAAYFAPDVLSMGDSTRYQDYTLRFAYNVMRQADIYLGARYVRGDYKNASDAYYDTGMHVGLTLRF